MRAAADGFFVANIKSCGLRVLDWVYRFAQELDSESPEYGGIRNNYDSMRREFRRSGHGLCLTWSACLAGFAGLAAYDLTGDPFYFERVKLLARYVKSNQNLDESDTPRYGTFVVSRDRRFVDVPDSSWAGNLFVHLYRRTGEEEYLDRARLAADWLLKQAAMSHGGFATFYLLDQGKPVAYSHASDGQHGLFLATLYEQTKDERYAAALGPLADMLSGPGQHETGPYYASLRADGTPVFEGWDEEAGLPLVDGIEATVTGPRQDYYAAMFLLREYQREGKEKYLASAQRCCEWAWDWYRREGYFPEWATLRDERWVGDRPDVASPGAMTLLWLALHGADADTRWLDACCEVSEWSMRWQRTQPDYADLHGAIVAEPVIVGYHQSFAAWGLLELARLLEQSA